MLDLNELQRAQSQVALKNRERDVHFERHLRSAQQELRLFQVNHNKQFLENAVAALLQALEHKETIAKPYIYLAYAMFCVNEEVSGFAYLKHARSLDPEDPMVQNLQDIMSNENDTASKTMPDELRFFEALKK
jgi:hypothetical protein